MMNQFKTFAAAVLSAVLFAACSDSDEGGFNIRNIDASGNVLVVCQGNQGVKLPGTLDLYSASQDTLFSSVFRAVNGADLGVYWSVTLNKEFPYRAWGFHYNSSQCHLCGSSDRNRGQTVRAVVGRDDL